MFQGKSAYESKDLFGKIFIKYKQGGKSKLEVPYWVTVYEGGLIYNESVTQYLVDRGDVDYSSRNFTVTNKYKYPLAINNISLSTEAKEYFTVRISHNKLIIYTNIFLLLRSKTLNLLY